MGFNSKTSITRARELRQNQTPAENALWELLRDKKFHDFKFRRQHPKAGYILDFYCDELKLGIEVDGSIHTIKEQADYDEQRTKFLNEFGISIIRFSNDEVLSSPMNVLQKIRDIADRPSPLAPLPQGERGWGEGINYYRFESILQREGWMTPAYIGIDPGGIIKYLSTEPPDNGIAFESVLGFALPGFQNAHSHAFQYGMAGLAENHPSGVDDDFWSWREAMYQCALSMNPDQAEAVATMLYTEMLSHGYTHVAEFHYLHHDQSGKPYSNVAEMGERMIAAAKTAGIRITLIPVFYQKGGFGQPPQPRQKRFISTSVDDYFHLFQTSQAIIKHYDHASLGLSVHSLRAVDLDDIIRTVELAPKNLPFHIHVAEQLKEVNDCLSFCGLRPMLWMLENLPLDSRFHLVHSTHLDDRELSGLVGTGAHVVLCPSTEGNLGDGIFRMKEFSRAGGQWSIGTDSHIGLNPLEELRMIDYRQRLVTHKRNTFDGDAASYLVQQAFKGGQAAMGLHTQNHFEIGQPLDAVVYASQNPLLEATSSQHRLASIVYHTHSSSPIGTLVGGKWIVKNGIHKQVGEIQEVFKNTVKSLALR